MTNNQIKKILAMAAVTLGAVLVAVGVTVGVGAGVAAAEDNGFRVNRSVLTAYLGDEEFVTIPSDVTSIGEGAFRNNEKLKAVEIPPNVREISFNAFKNCTALKDVYISDSVEKVGPGAFEGCTSLETVEIGKNVSSWGTGVFVGCDKLAEIIVDEDNEYLTYYNGALYNGNMSMLYQVMPARDGENYVMPKEVKNVDAYALWNMQNTKNVKVSANLAAIPSYALAGMGSVDNVILTNSVTTIADRAFAGNAQLKQAIIPSNTTDISKKAFSGYGDTFRICTTKGSAAEKFAVSKKIPVVYDSEDYPMDIMDSNTNTTTRPNVGDGSSNPPSASNSGSSANGSYTEGNSGQSVTVDNRINSDNGDNNDNSENNEGTSVSGSDTGSSASTTPKQGSYVHPLDIPAQKGELGKTVIVAGKAVVLMNNRDEGSRVYQADAASKKADSENDTAGTADKSDKADNSDTDKSDNADNAENSENNDKSDNTNSDSTKAENNNKTDNNKSDNTKSDNDKSIDDSSIAQRQFYKDKELAQYEIGDNIKSIGRLAFAESGLKRITIPEGVETIEYGAFMGCDDLAEVKLAASVKSIGTKAFEGTPWLEAWKNSAVSDDFLIVGDGILLAYKGSAAEVVIPDGVKQIGSEAFKNHDEIEKATFPDSLTAINAEAFRNCSRLSTLIGGDNVKDVARGAFYGTLVEDN